MNEILINIKNEVSLPKKRSIISSNIYNENKNYNSYEIHKRIFDDKLIDIQNDYKKGKKLISNWNYIMPDLKEKRKINNSKIPLPIKGYNKKE